MTTEKIIGFGLLALGVVIILYALFASYGIFTGSQEPPEIFKEPVAISVSGTSSSDVEEQVGAVLESQLAKLLPADTVSKTLNLFAWSIFTGLLVFGGSQIAGIGVKLLKK